jgi:hypothetical protein
MENGALVAPLPFLPEYCFQKKWPRIQGQVWGELVEIRPNLSFMARKARRLSLANGCDEQNTGDPLPEISMSRI